jgi:hypothetical protein
LSRLDLLRDEGCLRFGSRARRIVGLECEEDHEAQQQGEAGGEHPEDARGAITVAEVAPFRRSPTDQEHAEIVTAQATTTISAPKTMFMLAPP